jgi:MFS superfamily sulfate permease-like transporter
VTTLGVVTIGILGGIVVAVVLAVINLLRRVSRPHDAVLGQVPGREGFVNLQRDPAARPVPGMLIYRFDAPLYFFNADHFKRRVGDLVEQGTDDVRWFVLDAEAISDIDLTAAHVLREVVETMRSSGVTLVIARAHGRLREHLARSGLTAEVGEHRFFDSVRTAVAAIGRTSHAD